MKALVVEENIALAAPAARMLRRLGCRVGIASGMLGARIVTCDTIRPRFDRHADVGDGRCRRAEALRELGFDDHLSKPFRQSRMLEMLNKQLRPHAQAESTDSAGGGGVAAGDRQAAPSVLDATALGRLAELDPKGENRLLQRVLQAFQGSVARLRPQLDAARRGGDRSAIRLVAHTLKSSSASIGAVRLSQLCGQVETAVRLDAGADLSPLLIQLDEALDGALQAIDALLKEQS